MKLNEIKLKKPPKQIKIIPYLKTKFYIIIMKYIKIV